MHFERRGNERQSVGTTVRYQKKNQGDKRRHQAKVAKLHQKQRTFQVFAGQHRYFAWRQIRYSRQAGIQRFCKRNCTRSIGNGRNSFCGTNGNSATEQRPARSHSRRKSGNTKNFAGIYRQNISCFAKDRCFGRNYQRHRRNFQQDKVRFGK